MKLMPKLYFKNSTKFLIAKRGCFSFMLKNNAKAFLKLVDFRKCQK
jgi:hypothetical protein